MNRATHTWMRLTFTVGRRMDFYEDMAAFDAEGIPPFQALKRIREVGKPRKSMRWLVNLLNPIIRAGAEGAGLAAALRPWVPQEESAMLAAGEKGGQLREALMQLADMLRTRIAIKDALKRNLVPSAVTLAAMLALMVYVLNTVLSQGRSLVPDEVFHTLMFAPYYFGIGQWVLDWLWLLIISAVVGIIAIAVSLPRWRPRKTRKWLDSHLPPWTLFARIQSAFFLLTAASMMRAGQPFQSAADDIQRFADPWLKAYIKKMQARLASGQHEVKSMQVGMLPWDVEDRLAVYAMLPDFLAVMQSTARDSMKALLRKVDAIGNVIRITIMAALGLFIVITVFSLGEISLAIQSSLNQLQQ